MTLNQIERLVRKIAEVLGQPALEAQAAKLAQDYAELARAAHRRLEQCAVMIEAGDELQALQLAETPPPLLDLITLVSFRQAGEWRAYCQAHNLPWTEPFFDKYVRLLNATYGKGIASDHPYYRDYRRAVMQNEDERALSILRVIARLNPADQNSAQELKRLEEKALRSRLEELRAALDRGDDEAALSLAGKLESSPLKIPPANPVWQRAQVIRCQRLLARAEALRQQEIWQEVEPLVEEVRGLASQHALVFPAADADAFEALESWTGQRRSAFIQEQDFQRAVEGLQYAVQSLETKRAADGAAAPAEWQSEFDTLAAKWREAERFGRPLDESLLARCQEQCDWLQRQMNRGRRRKQIVGTLATVAVLVAVVAAGVLGWSFLQQQRFLDQLQRLQSGRHVAETQKVLAEIPARLKTKARLAAAISKAQEFVSKEDQLKRAFADKFERLNGLARQGVLEVSAQVEQQRADCAETLKGLAPEFQPEAKANLDRFDQGWQQRLQALQPEINGRFAVRLAEAEKVATQRLNAANGYDAVRTSLPQVQALAADLAKKLNGPVGPEEALVRRWRQWTNEVNGIARAVDHWAALTAQAPHSIEQHLARLNQMSESPFVPAAEQAAIADFYRVSVSLPALLGSLLLPHDRPAWAMLTNFPAADPTFRPGTPSAQELEAYEQLRNDPNLHEVNDYFLTKNPHPGNPMENHHIFVRGKLQENRLGQETGLLYDWKKSPDTLRFEQQVIDSYDYIQADYKGLTKECAAFQALGVADLLTPDNSHYQRAILELLDRLNQDRESSPLFRAYVTVRLWDLAQQRPLEWGLPWAPAAAMHVQNLKWGLGAENLGSGDWLVSNRVARVNAILDGYFGQSRAVWFAKQAQFLYRLARQSCQAGFSFAGYIDAQGKPILTQTNAIRGEYWGWSNRSKAPALLLRRPEGAPTCQQLEEPLPLTPLFVFRVDRRQLLERTASAALYSGRGADQMLPPLFLGLEP